MPRPRCKREGCRRGQHRSGNHPYCCPVCAHLDKEFDRVQDMFLEYDDPRTTDVWTALVEASDAWTNYLETRRKLVSAYPERQRRRTGASPAVTTPGA